MENQADIFITGGSGMLATAFRSLLPQATFADRGQFDVANAQHRLQLAQSKPKVVINCAGYTKVDQAETEPDAAERVNGSAVGALAQTCKRVGATLIHFSTDYVFDGTTQRPLLPSDPVGPASAYGRSKLIGEQLIQRDPPPRWLIIRTSWLFGPGGANFPNTIVKATRDGKPLSVINDQVGSPTYTNDLAVATLDLLASTAKGIYHVANAGQTTWHDYAVEIVRHLHLRADISATTSQAWKAARPMSAIRPHYSVLDTSGYKTITGKSLRGWKDALHDYLDHHQR